jgi:ubiquinone/menaquinone biosynthesis C-methylase UbiE
MLKAYLIGLFQSASRHNRRNILDLVRHSNPEILLDLGCDDGTWTQLVANAASAKRVWGLEIVPSQAALARGKHIEVQIADLAQKLPYEDNSIDLIHANQVIEHVPDVDLFASEIWRVLKPGGTFVISTENGSSWHNILAAILGWQTFSLSNMSRLKAGIGNPMALLRNQDIEFSTWTHKVIFNYRGLLEFFQAYQFQNIQIKGAGYYPLPTTSASWDPRHAHFLTASGRKPL